MEKWTIPHNWRFYTPLWATDRTNRQKKKISKDINDQNNTIKSFDLIDIYNTTKLLMNTCFFQQYMVHSQK